MYERASNCDMIASDLQREKWFQTHGFRGKWEPTAGVKRPKVMVQIGMVKIIEPMPAHDMDATFYPRMKRSRRSILANGVTD